jgi:hypothetical protein
MKQPTELLNPQLQVPPEKSVMLFATFTIPSTVRPGTLYYKFSFQDLDNQQAFSKEFKVEIHVSAQEGKNMPMVKDASNNLDLLLIAGRMEDHCLGTFEKCLKALEDCGGDEEKARFKLLEPSIRY